MKIVTARHEYLLSIHDELLLAAMEGNGMDEIAYCNWKSSPEGRELRRYECEAAALAERNPS